MQKTLLKIQELLDDIHGDTTLLKLTLITNKVERVRQLFEGLLHGTNLVIGKKDEE